LRRGRARDVAERRHLILVAVRHGETEWALARRHTGRTDIPLTANGRVEAERLRPRLAGRTFAAVFASPLSRAWDTAALAGLSAVADEDLLEWDYGDYEGITTDEVRVERPGWLLWRDGCPGGESPGDVAARTDRVIARALQADGDVCLVAHAHLLRMLAVRWLEQPHELGARLHLRTATISELGWEREHRALRSWST
jgi:broad specificity phosphatase PhoE